MTEEDLKPLELSKEALDQVLELHGRELDALRTERDDLARRLAEAEERGSAMERSRRDEALTEALIRRGAHPQAARLLLPLCQGAEWKEDGTLANGEALADSLRQEWGGLFLREERIGTETVAPPVSGGRGISREALRSMTPEEINRLWPEIRDLLND